MIAADDAGLFEGAHAAQAWRGRDLDAADELDIGHAPLRQQMPQYATVDTVELYPPHPIPLPDFRIIKRNSILAQFYCG